MYDNLKKASNTFNVLGIVSAVITVCWLWTMYDEQLIYDIEVFKPLLAVINYLYFLFVPALFFALARFFKVLYHDLQTQNVAVEERLQKIKAELLKEIEAKAGQN